MDNPNLQLPTVKPQADEVLVKVDNIGKIFCRNFRKSLAYGVMDGAGDLLPLLARKQDAEGNPVLRKDEFWANQGISFELRRGECIGLIGHNGAGKTTLLKMLNGLIKPDTGSIEMRGRVGALIALNAGFNPILTGRENVYITGSVFGMSKKEIDAKFDEIVDFAELWDFIDSPVQNYSSGMQVRLGFAVASVIEPDVLLMDEILAVGDVSFQAKCFNTLASMRKQGVPFILVSHNMHQISRYCQKVVYLEHGKIKFNGDVNEGVKRFVEDMGEKSISNNQGPDWSKVHGSGKIVITGARFRNNKGEIVDGISAGDPVIFEIDFEQKSSGLCNLVVDLVIRSHGDNLFQRASEQNEIFGGIWPERGTISLDFKGVPINKKSLDFYIAFLDKESGEIFDWKRDLRLNIKTKSDNSGSMQLDLKISMTESNAT
jgi:lipopolysaccharide transport system ATP-binding protein